MRNLTFILHYSSEIKTAHYRTYECLIVKTRRKFMYSVNCVTSHNKQIVSFSRHVKQAVISIILSYMSRPGVEIRPFLALTLSEYF